MKPTLLAIAALSIACTSVAPTVALDQERIKKNTGVAIGRLGFVASKKIALQTFQMAAISVPDGDKYWIHALPAGEDGDAGAFFVSLPPGNYRLTEWVATSAETEWAGEDAGLSIEIVRHEVVCIGALYLHPRERQRFRLEQDAAPPTVVRDECEALGTTLQQRSTLARGALVKVAQPVSRRRS
jgi:hypothetical protein